MEAELVVYPLSKSETQLELQGRCSPPLGALGGALDSLVGHRIADASVHRFVPTSRACSGASSARPEPRRSRLVSLARRG
jgi:hypothetical protein